MSWKWQAWMFLDLLEHMTPGTSIWKGVDIYRTEKRLEDVLEGKGFYDHPIDNRLQRAAYKEAYDNNEEWICEQKGVSKLIQGVLVDGVYSALIAGVIGIGTVFPQGYPSSLEEYVVVGALTVGGMVVGGLKAHTHSRLSDYHSRLKVKQRLATNKHRFQYWKDSGKISPP